MHEAGFDEAVDAICAKDARYHREAYLFLREALDYTQKTIGKDHRGRIRHVSGQELLKGICEFACEKFGPMAMMLLEEWGVHNCQDFGEIVFNMVEANLLAKTEQDSRADFEGGYTFFEAFRKPFLPPSRLRSQAPEPKPTGA